MKPIKSVNASSHNRFRLLHPSGNVQSKGLPSEYQSKDDDLYMSINFQLFH